MKILVSVPAYNEAKTLGLLIDDIHASMKGYDYSVLVLDDGSQDKTVEVAKKHKAQVVSHPMNYGLAETFRSEIKVFLDSKKDVLVHIDADRQYLPKEIPKLLKEIENGNDLVLGSRFLGHIESMPFIKRLGNQAFSKIISGIIKKKITDGQTGFRAFTRIIAQNLHIISDHTYTQEQIIRAVKHKFKVKEVPVYFAKRKDKSRLISNPFGYALRAWINIIRIIRDFEPLKFFGVIGSSIFGAGFIIGLYLIYLHFTTGIVGRMGILILDVVALSIGFQIIIFGFIADMIKKED